MNQEDIIRMAREANIKQAIETPHLLMVHELERFAALAASAEREKLAAWMMRQGYATGHGDNIEDLLKELEWQIREREREACAKVQEFVCSTGLCRLTLTQTNVGIGDTQAIRARDEQ